MHVDRFPKEAVASHLRWQRSDPNLNSVSTGVSTKHQSSHSFPFLYHLSHPHAFTREHLIDTNRYLWLARGWLTGEETLSAEVCMRVRHAGKMVLIMMLREWGISINRGHHRNVTPLKRET